MAKKILINAVGAVNEHLSRRMGTPPFYGQLHDHINGVTGASDPFVTYQPARGGAGLLCVSTITSYGGSVVEVA